MALHKNLTGADLHEPKGIAAVSTAGFVYAADGAGSGTWTGGITPATLELTTAVYRSIDKDLLTLQAGAAAPGTGTLTNDGSGSTGVLVKAFDKTTEESLHGCITLPQDYKIGTNITPHIEWSATDANAGNVVWGLEYVACYPGSAFTTSTILTITEAAPTAVKKIVDSDFAVISGTSLLPGYEIRFRIFRKSADGSDTYDNDANGHTLRFFYSADVIGTSAKFPSS